MKMRIGRATWAKKHWEGVLAIISLILTIGFFVYQNQAADQAQRVLQSEIDAAFRAMNAIQHGGNAQIFQQPNGQYSVALNQNFHVNLNFSVILSVAITCRNGIVYHPTGPFSCPGESTVPSYPTYAGR
jgi:plasmid maintenance system killer protein